MELAIIRTLVVLGQINMVCHQLALMELYIWGMFERGVQLTQPQDYDSRRARGEA